MSTSVEFTTSAKGRPLMVLDGYSYIRDRQTDEKTYWRCENHKKLNCHYRIHTCNFTTNTTHANILKRNGVHTTSCHRDPIKISLRKFHEDLVDRAKNTQESTDTVLSKCLTQLSTPARLRLPPLDHVKRTVRQHRKENNLPNIPNDVDFPSVPTILQFTKRNEIFLRIDTGPGPDRMLIFSSPEQCSILASSTEFLVDGTFD
ncbi:unnamed protein product, partial [Rotaria sp. Silwood1]